MLFTKHVFFDHVPCSDFPRFPTISRHFPGTPPPRASSAPPPALPASWTSASWMYRLVVQRSWPARLTKRQGEVRAGRKTRIRPFHIDHGKPAQHGQDGRPYRLPRVLGSRDTKHETRVFSDTHHGFSRSMAFTVVRFAVGAQGMHNRKPPPGPPRLPPSHCLPVRCGAAVARVERLLWCGWSGSERHGAAYCP